jgi:hypothetical protein
MVGGVAGTDEKKAGGPTKENAANGKRDLSERYKIEEIFLSKA